MRSLVHRVEKLGLSENEAATYLAALEGAFGVSVAGVARKTGIKRSTVYLALAALMKRGLVSMSRRGSRHVYVAEDPRVFAEKLKEQELYLRGLLPELLSVTNMLARKPAIRFFEGPEGIKEVYRDTLTVPGSEIRAWATADIAEHFDAAWLTGTYVPARVSAKIAARTLAPDTPELRTLAGENAAALRTLRLLPADEALFSVEANLYAKRKVALVSFREEFGIIIESATIHDTLGAIFESAWARTGK